MVDVNTVTIFIAFATSLVVSIAIPAFQIDEFFYKRNMRKPNLKLERIESELDVEVIQHPMRGNWYSKYKLLLKLKIHNKGAETNIHSVKVFSSSKRKEIGKNIWINEKCKKPTTILNFAIIIEPKGMLKHFSEKDEEMGGNINFTAFKEDIRIEILESYGQKIELTINKDYIKPYVE